MKKTLSIAFLIAAFIPLIAQKKMSYPVAVKDTTANYYFSERTGDPFRYMENLEDEYLNNWLTEQKQLTKKMGNKLAVQNSVRNSLYYLSKTTKDKISKASDVPFDKEGNFTEYFFSLKEKSYSRSADLMYRKCYERTFSTLVNIKSLQKEKGDNIEIKRWVVNNEEDLLAVMIARNGSDWREVYFYDLDTGEQLEDHLLNLRVASRFLWHDGGLLYVGFDAPEEGREQLDWVSGSRVNFHEIGTDQSEDKVLSNGLVSSDGYFQMIKNDEKLLFKHEVKLSGKWYRSFSYSAISSDTIIPKPLLVYPDSDSISVDIAFVRGGSVFFKTTWNTPNGRVIKVDFDKPNKPVQFIPEFDIRLDDVNMLGSKYVACQYNNNGQDLILIFNSKGELAKKLPFPQGKKVYGFYDNREEAKGTRYDVSSFYHPTLSFWINFEDLVSEPVVSVTVPYDFDDFVTRYVHYTADDGTKIPMYITHKKNIQLNGKNPTLIYAYGGYGVKVEPKYDIYMMNWILHGGIYAVPDVRGGGGRNSEWSKLGQGINKKNGISDLIDAAEFLIEENYTDSEHLGLNGRSHGGLLVSAAAVKRPDLFKAVIAEAGLYDMLRYEQYTIGLTSSNKKEFGSVDNLEEYKSLLSYSPLHNIKKGIQYPDFLLITGDSDTRVVPFHTYKFLATLQQEADPKGRYILYLEEGAGHAGSTNRYDYYDTIIYKYSFLFNRLGKSLL